MPDGNSREPPHTDCLRVYSVDELRERSKRIAVADEAISNFDYLMSEHFNPKRPGARGITKEDVLHYNRINSITGFRVCLAVWLNSALIDPDQQDNPFAVEFEYSKGIITRTDIGESVVENLGTSASEKAKSSIKRRYDRAVDAGVFFDLIRESDDARANKKPLLATQRLNDFMDAVTHFECDQEAALTTDPLRADLDAAPDAKDDPS